MPTIRQDARFDIKPSKVAHRLAQAHSARGLGTHGRHAGSAWAFVICFQRAG